jgi:hypothetical protein
MCRALGRIGVRAVRLSTTRVRIAAVLREQILFLMAVELAPHVLKTTTTIAITAITTTVATIIITWLQAAYRQAAVLRQILPRHNKTR